MSDTHAPIQAYRPIAELLPDHWQEGSIAVDPDTTLHYWRTGGAKPVLLLLHGFQSAALNWLRCAMALEDSYDLILLDFRGHGLSAGPAHRFSLDQLTADTAALIKALDLGSVFVLGHSMGAEVAGRVAAAYPDQVRAVVMEDPPMRPFSVQQAEPLPPWMQRWFIYMQTLKTQSHAERLASAVEMLPPGVPLWEEADFVPYVEAQAQLDLGIMPHAGTMDYRMLEREQIARIQCPLLLLVGDPKRGSGYDPAVVAAAQTVWQHGRLHQFVAAGHFIHSDVFPAFLEIVRNFLASQEHPA